MVQNLYLETACQLRCLLGSIFVVGTFRNFGSAKKVAVVADSINAICYRHDKFPEQSSRGYNGQPLCLPGWS